MKSFKLSGRGKTIDLYPWLAAKAKGVEALAGITGFGLPGLTNYWVGGAGTSRKWRGAKVDPVLIKIPLEVYAEDRAALNRQLSDLAMALDPFTSGGASDEGSARLSFGLPDDTEWFRDVVRSGPMDWARKTDSDDETYFRSVLTLESTDAFWTRTSMDSFEVKLEGTQQPLLPRVAELSLSSSSAFGTVEVLNSGNAIAWGEFIVYGPASRILLIGANGETVDWTGNIDEGNAVKFIMRAGTVTGSNGANRYAGLAAAPHFWAIPPGNSEITIQIEGATGSTSCVARWAPRRWAVV